MDILLKDFNPVSMLRVPEHPKTAAKYPVIDIHTHWGPILFGPDYKERWDLNTIIPQLKACNIAQMFNLELLWDEPLKIMEKDLEPSNGYIITCPSVDIRQCEDPGFDEMVKTHFEAYAKAGVKAIKLWKDMTLYFKDSSGKYLRLDDERYEPLWKYAGIYKLPIIIHIGDPHSLFTPVDEHNEYLDIMCGHPEWSYQGPEYWSFDDHMEMQENIIKNHPDTTFIIAHIGSCGEDLSKVEAMMDKYPNMYIDIAARLSELGRQPYTSRKFLIKFQDRIFFGTDYEGGADPAMFYHPYFRFLETYDEYFDYMGAPRSNDYGRWKIYGVGLTDEVLRKIYYENACKMFNLPSPV